MKADIERILRARNAFEALDLPDTATAEEAQRAWKKLSFRIHPDKCDHCDATAAMQRLNDLMDSAKKRAEQKARPAATKQTSHWPPRPGTAAATGSFAGARDGSRESKDDNDGEYESSSHAPEFNARQRSGFSEFGSVDGTGWSGFKKGMDGMNWSAFANWQSWGHERPSWLRSGGPDPLALAREQLRLKRDRPETVEQRQQRHADRECANASVRAQEAAQAQARARSRSEGERMGETSWMAAVSIIPSPRSLHCTVSPG